MHLYLDRNKLERRAPRRGRGHREDAQGVSRLLQQDHRDSQRYRARGRAPAWRASVCAGTSCRFHTPRAWELPRELARLDLSGTRSPDASERHWRAPRTSPRSASAATGSTGSIPNALASFRSCASCVVNNNKLTGPIPDVARVAPVPPRRGPERQQAHRRDPETLWDPDPGRRRRGASARALPSRAARQIADEEEREHHRCGLNPLFCPLPDWADEVRRRAWTPR